MEKRDHIGDIAGAKSMKALKMFKENTPRGEATIRHYSRILSSIVEHYEELESELSDDEKSQLFLTLQLFALLHVAGRGCGSSSFVEISLMRSHYIIWEGYVNPMISVPENGERAFERKDSASLMEASSRRVLARSESALHKSIFSLWKLCPLKTSSYDLEFTNETKEAWKEWCTKAKTELAKHTLPLANHLESLGVKLNGAPRFGEEKEDTIPKDVERYMECGHHLEDYCKKIRDFQVYPEEVGRSAVATDMLQRLTIEEVLAQQAEHKGKVSGIVSACLQRNYCMFPVEPFN